MRIIDYFKPVPSVSTDEVRDIVRGKRHEEYNLIDVRQPAEYDNGHIKGARLIPLPDLRRRASELDPSLPTIAY